MGGPSGGVGRGGDGTSSCFSWPVLLRITALPLFPWTYRAGSFQRGLCHPTSRGSGIRLVLGLCGEPSWLQHPRELGFVLTASFSSSIEKSVIASSHKLLPALPFYRLQPFSCDTGPINLVRTISPHWVLSCLARLLRLLHHLVCFL